LDPLQESARQKQSPAIRVRGEGMVSLPPDVAELHVAVVSEAESAQAAAEDNARRVAAVTSELRRFIGDKADLKTAGYSVQPVYRQPREGGKPEIAGYSARNTIQVTLTDLSQVGKAIDSSVRAGANSIDRLNFKLKDETAARAEALRRASAAGRAKATAVAAELGLRILRIVTVEEIGAGGPPRPLEADLYSMRTAAAPPTAIEPGAIEVHASVLFEVEVGQ
jgi:uncharacterized protein YggE